MKKNIIFIKNRTLKFLSLIISFLPLMLTAQNKPATNFKHEFTPQIMTRGEYRHGYQYLFDTGQKPAAFIGQRTRLTYKMTSDKFDIVTTIQDVRIWGSSANSGLDTSGKLALAEGYGVIKFDKSNKLKIGRQIISYDQDRIIGTLDWAFQARRHDLIVFEHKNDSVITYHVGAAWNQKAESLNSSYYFVPKNYKTFQYLWLFRQMKKGNVGFLFLNNGTQQIKTTGSKKEYFNCFTQTIGLNGNTKIKGISINIFGYYQTGYDATVTNSSQAAKYISAYDVGLDINYKANKNILVSAGGEIISGTSQDPSKNKNSSSFNPLFGTNHRFNGYMDYFYVGTHTNSVGLSDVYIKFNYEKNNWIAFVNFHNFRSANDIRDNKKSTASSFVAMNRQLGQEIDLTFLYKITDGVSVQAGYSQMFGTESMVALKGGSTDVASNWAYLMIHFRPGTIFPRTGIKQ